MDKELITRIETLEKDLQALNEEVYKNNFSTYQEFNKRSNFTVGLKVPKYSAVPEVDEAGYIVEVGGKIYVSTAKNTWELVGGQTA